MKKILFTMAAVMIFTLTSCFEGTGFKQEGKFSRIVTINRSATPLQLDADYTDEKFKLSNLTSVDQLGAFGLKDADRAIVNIHYTIDETYKADFKLASATNVNIIPIWNKPLPENKDINPLFDLYRIQFENNWKYPHVWITGKYLNVAPVIRSKGPGSYYLKPTAVYGDTLRFDITAEYTNTNISTDEYVDFVNFDLSTLTDTTDADAATLTAVRSMLNTIGEKDSVCVMLMSDIEIKTDSIVKAPAYTGYSNQLKRFVY